jgi:hypothetical protein
MKITLNELKQIIKKEINETFITPEQRIEMQKQEKQTSSNYDDRLEISIRRKYDDLIREIHNTNLGKFSIFIKKYNQNNDILIISIDPKKALINLFNIFLNYDSYRKANISNLFLYDNNLNMFNGMVALTKLVNPDCYGSYQTSNVAAQEGYGPRMYEIAASWVKKHGGNYNKITSDRFSVKPAARKVWASSYSSRVNDYNVYKFDNFGLPQEKRRTPDDPWDDCHIHTGGESHLDDYFLNHAYEIKQPENYEPFEETFELFLDVAAIIITKLFKHKYLTQKPSLFDRIKKFFNISSDDINLLPDNTINFPIPTHEKIKSDLKDFFIINSYQFFQKKYGNR